MNRYSPTILVIDDSFSSNLLVQDILNENGYKTITTERAQTGLKLISQKFPDLVILDIMMPQMDGFTVLKKILKKRKIPVIMLSAIKDKNDIQKAFDLGASGYLTKPVIIDELLKIIKEKINN